MKKPLPVKLEAKANRGKRILKWLSQHYHNILYICILFVLWLYIISNWERCISMRFFCRFDGNNILFLLGIVLVILPFYDIEGKGIKLRKREMTKEEKRAQDEKNKAEIEQREMGINMTASKINEEKIVVTKNE